MASCGLLDNHQFINWELSKIGKFQIPPESARGSANFGNKRDVWPRETGRIRLPAGGQNAVESGGLFGL